MADDGKDLRDKSVEHVEGNTLPQSASHLTQDKIFILKKGELLVDFTDLSYDNKYQGQGLNKNVLDRPTNSFSNSVTVESNLTVKSSISAPTLTSTHNLEHNVSSALAANVQGLTSSDKTVSTANPAGSLSPTSLRVNPFNVPNAVSRQLAAPDETTFDPLAFGDPTFINTYFTSSPGHEESQRARPRAPQNERSAEGFAGASPALAPPRRTNQLPASASHHNSPTSQRVNTGGRIGPSNQNAGPVVLQDYTGNFSPGRTQVLKPLTDSSVSESKGVNIAEVVPHVEIVGYPGNMQGVAGRRPDSAVGNVTLASQLFAYDDGAEDDLCMLEDAPLLDSQTAASASPRHAGRPSKWSRGARDEAGNASTSSHGLKKERDLSAPTVGVYTGNMPSQGEIDSLRDNAHGVATHNGSIGHHGGGARLADKSQLPGNTVWQRNSYGHFSPSPEEVPSLAYRHCHRKKCASLTDRLALRQLIAVVVLCLLFMAGEAIGGVLSNSLALFTDVLHLGSDLISFIISLLAMWLARKPASKKMSFGYHRAEVMGALVSVFIIWLISGILCYIAVERIIKGHYKEVKPDEMLITASLGVLFNFIMAFVLHSEVCCNKAHSHQKFGHGHSHGGHGHSHGGHGHSHGGHGHSHDGHGQEDSRHNHSHSDGCNSDRSQWNESLDHKDLLDVPDPVEGRSPATADFNYHQLHQDSDFESSGHQMVNVLSERGGEEEEDLPKHKNINVRAAFIHVVGDIIQSLGVLVAALIIKFTEDEKFRLADPICTFLFSVLVLITTITILRDAMLVVMEGVPRDLSFDTLKKDLKALDGVVAVHSLHIWALTLDRNSLAVHLVIENPEIQNQVLNSATKLLQDRYHFFHTTIQVDLYNQVMSDCHECLELN